MKTKGGVSRGVSIEGFAQTDLTFHYEQAHQQEAKILELMQDKGTKIVSVAEYTAGFSKSDKQLFLGVMKSFTKLKTAYVQTKEGVRLCLTPV
ncbi:hypothetical protein [Enterococcus faecium]|uniref:Uncharacterized protein n=1 Tax=Enterococcus faecium TaxID=1352 RepID=A0A9X4B549_ENTFC|nr:hypothetical protein [Enterococcus faecium]MDC4248088.1 hypothetical protein [Enterococcus faecium]